MKKALSKTHFLGSPMDYQSPLFKPGPLSLDCGRPSLY